MASVPAVGERRAGLAGGEATRDTGEKVGCREKQRVFPRRPPPQGYGGGLWYHPEPGSSGERSSCSPMSGRSPRHRAASPSWGGLGGLQLLLGLLCPPHPPVVRGLPLPPPRVVLGWALARLNLGGSISTPIPCPGGGEDGAKVTGEAEQGRRVPRGGVCSPRPRLSPPAPWIPAGCEAMGGPGAEAATLPAVSPWISRAVTWGRAR